MGLFLEQKIKKLKGVPFFPLKIFHLPKKSEKNFNHPQFGANVKNKAYNCKRLYTSFEKDKIG